MTQNVDIESAGLNPWRIVFASAILIVTMAFAMVTLLSQPLFAADIGPHGHFTSGTDKCKSCHQVHAGQTSTLLTMPSVTQVCLSCHSKGQGADTGVAEGTYFDATDPDHSWGANGGALLGGGFDCVAGGTAVTGSHQLEVAGKPYGSTTGVSYVMTCVACHTPHEGPNYRLLRRNVADSPADIRVVSNQPDKNYTVTDYGAAPGVQEYTRNYKNGIATWCTACHAKYMTRGGVFGTDVYDAGDAFGAVSRYRHAINVPITGVTDAANQIAYNLTTNLPLQDTTGNGRTADDTLTCLTCHQVHGSAARMRGSAILPASKRVVLPNGGNGMLLRQDDRTMCRDCHNMM